MTGQNLPSIGSLGMYFSAWTATAIGFAKLFLHQQAALISGKACSLAHRTLVWRWNNHPSSEPSTRRMRIPGIATRFCLIHPPNDLPPLSLVSGESQAGLILR